MAKKVLIGLVTAWRLAGRPTSFSPSSVKATIEGVVLHALGVGDHLRRLAFHDGDARVGGAEVDADDFAHLSSVLFCCGETVRTRSFGVRSLTARDGLSGTVPWL